MKLEYSLAPADQIFYMQGISSRILTSNLLNNKKIDVQFSPVCTNIDYNFLKYLENNMDDVRNSFSNRLLGMIVHGWFVFSSKYILLDEYKKTLLSLFKEEYVILTINHLLDLITVKHLLEDNRKVIIGGTPVILYSSKYIRHILDLMGATNLHNLLLISGYVDLYTDLHPLIKKWEDCDVQVTNPQSFWNCRDDFLDKYSNLSKLIYKRRKSFNRYSYKSSILTMSCWWGKCSYCSYTKLPIFDFRSDTDTMTESLVDMLVRSGENTLRFTDSYFEFDEQNIELLKNLKGYDINILSGIHRMKNIEYTRNINKYTKKVAIGVEAIDNDCLKRVNKGTNEEMIWKTVDNIIRYVDRDKELTFFMMADLPFKNEDRVKRNYDMDAKLKRTLEDNGFHKSVFSFALMHIYEANRERMFSLKPHIGEPADIISGRYQLYKDFDDHDPVYMKKITMPFSRYDDKGNLMRSDFNIIGDEFEYLINTKEELDARDC